MQKSGNIRIRLAALSLIISGIFFVVYPAIRPFPMNRPYRELRLSLPSRGFWPTR
jgi:hypothetical protein